MLFSIGIALMIVLVAGFWTYQGFFSSALMFFECAISSVVAFGFYEPLNGIWASALGNGIGKPLAFAVLFLVPLTILRLATDRFFKNPIHLNPIIDRAGSGVFGLLSSLLLVGTALVGVQMLPIGADIFGFNRLKVQPDGSTVQSNLIFKPDNFAVSLASIASGGSMSGDTALSRAKPDFLMDLYGARSCVQTEDTHDVPADCLKINAYWEDKQYDTVTQKLDPPAMSRAFETKDVASGKLLVFNVSLSTNAGVKDKTDVYFRLPQFRLIGPPPESGRSPRVVLASAMSDLYVNKNHNWQNIQTGQATRLVRFDPMTNFLLGPNQTRPISDGKGKNAAITGYKFDIAFEVPDDFEPWYIAYKNGARCEINKAKMFKQARPASASHALGNTGPGRVIDSVGEEGGSKGKGAKSGDKSDDKEAVGKVGKATGGAGHISDAKQAYVTTKLPVPIPKADEIVAPALRGGKLGECNFFVEHNPDLPKKDQVKEFEIPEGKKLVIIDADANPALSLYGRALKYAANVIAQTTLTTDKGETYFAQGLYVIAKQGNKVWVEIQYHPEADVPERCLVKAKKITNFAVENTPKDDRRFGYIFIVDPGAHIVSFSSGGPKQPVDIEVP